MGQQKVKILWNRVLGAAALLIAVIVIIVLIISSIVGGGNDESSSSKADKAVATVSSVAEVSSEDESSEEDVAVNLTVIIDPGHGGKDIGATDPTETRFEKDDVLKICLLVEKYLKEKKVTVIMTRSDDTFVTLDDRCSIANEARADLFVSIHRNLYEESAQGVEIWVDNDRPVTDTALAQNILDGLANVGISNNRGVQFGYIGNEYVDYQVNRETDMPSCLVELGFMQDDTDNILFDRNCDDYAKAIAEAIYKTAVDADLIAG